VQRAARQLRIDAHQSVRVGSSSMFGHFVDVNHAYRFQAPGHDAVVARLSEAGSGMPLAEEMRFPQGLGLERVAAHLQLELRRDGDGFVLAIESDQLLKGVHLEAPGHVPDDNHFHLTPQRRKLVRWRAEAGAPRLRVRVTALNCAEAFGVGDD
jgi:beta-mannosidase